MTDTMTDAFQVPSGGGGDAPDQLVAPPDALAPGSAPAAEGEPGSTAPSGDGFRGRSLAGSNPAPLGAVAPPEPPAEADLHPLLATAGAKRVADRNARVVDPQIPPKTRLLAGARLVAGNRGADRETYKLWQQDRTQPSPERSGTDDRQAAILAAADNLERGKALGGEAAVWLEATGVDPIDVARFDRAPRTGRAAELWGKMIAGGLDDDEAFVLADLVDRTGETLEDFDDDLTVGGGTVKEVGDRVRVHFGKEPAPGVVTALNLDSLPADAFDGDAEDEGFDTLVGDDIVVAAPVASQPTLRRAFPAAAKQGGSPRWLTVQPATVTGLLRAVDMAGLEPNANVAVHASGHPGLAPYDSLTFTTTDRRRMEKFRRLGAEHLGRGLVAAPRHARRSVTVDQLVDAPTVDELIDSTAWAIFDPDDAPAFDGPAVPVRSGDRDMVMVFGVGPDEAAEATTGFAYTNDGIAIETGYDGLEPFEDEPVWFEFGMRNGQTYRFSASREEAQLFPERKTSAVERWQIPVDDQNRATLNGLATHLETLDAKDVAAYVTGPAGEGFTEARERLWGDGAGNVAASRVTGLRSGPNVIPVWLRDNAALPDDNTVGPDLLDTTEAEGAAERVGSKWRYDARGYADLAETVRWGHQLGQKYGYDNVEVETDDGPLELVS